MLEVLDFINSVEELFYILFFFGAVFAYDGNNKIIDLREKTSSVYIMKASVIAILTLIVIHMVLLSYYLITK